MSKDTWTKFIKKLLSRKRSNRNYFLPREYIEALADRISSTNPTKAILVNTLVDFYNIAFGHGYQRKESDIKFFKDKQSRRIKESWNREKDSIDDLIHQKNK